MRKCCRKCHTERSDLKCKRFYAVDGIPLDVSACHTRNPDHTQVCSQCRNAHKTKPNTTRKPRAKSSSGVSISPVRVSTRITQRRLLSTNDAPSTTMAQAELSMETGERIALLRRLLVNHEPFDVIGDGNCLFTALLDSYYHCHYTIRSHPNACVDVQLLRNMICTRMRDFYRTTGLERLRRDANDRYIPSIESYVTRMEQDGVWGGKPEIRAFGQIFKCDIHIYILDQINETIIDDIITLDDATSIIYIGFIESHFLSMRKVRDDSERESDVDRQQIHREAVLNIKRLVHRTEDSTTAKSDDRTEQSRLSDLAEFQTFLCQQHKHRTCVACAELIEAGSAVLRPSPVAGSFANTSIRSLTEYLVPLQSNGSLKIASSGVVEHNRHGEPTSVTVCRSCDANLRQRECPQFAVARGFEYREVPVELKCLTPLEVSLISRYIPFITFDRLPSGRQYGTHAYLVFPHHTLFHGVSTR